MFQRNERYLALKQLIDERNAKTVFDRAYATNVNYFDVHGYTLLHYAAEAGDLHLVKELISHGANCNQLWEVEQSTPTYPIALAFKQGHLDVVQYLYYTGHADCTNLDSSTCTDDATKAWFHAELKKLLVTPGCVDGPYNQFANNAIREMQRLPYPIDTVQLSRAVEIGDVAFLEKYYEVQSKKFPYHVAPCYAALGKHVYNRFRDNTKLLLLSAKFGQLDAMLFLQKKGIKEHIDEYAENLLTVAAKYGSVEIIDYLLSPEINYPLNRQDSLQNTALMNAVLYEQPLVFNKLLNAGADITKENLSNETVLHLLARTSNNEILNDLCGHPALSDLIRKKDIYGKTVLDLAIEYKNDKLIETLLHILDLEEKENVMRKMPDIYGQKRAQINQAVIIRKMYYYLVSNNRDTSLFKPSNGLCSGFSKLHQWYVAQGREDYYFNTLALMSEWDGTEEKLLEKFPDTFQQKQYYNNLKELFEQWINDVVWLQATTGITDHTQRDFVRLYDFIKKDDADKLLLFYETNNHTKMDVEQKEELLKYFLRMPNHTVLFMRGFMHLTAIGREDKHLINFHDCNFKYIASLFDGNAKALRDRQNYTHAIITDERKTTDTTLHMGFFSKSKQSVCVDYEIFHENEYPESVEIANEFQNNSSNGFSFLHIAVITQSLPSLVRLLKDGYCNIISADKRGDNVLMLAVRGGFIEGIKAILEHVKLKGCLIAFNDIIKRWAYETSNMEVREVLLTYTNDEGLDMQRHSVYA